MSKNITLSQIIHFPKFMFNLCQDSLSRRLFTMVKIVESQEMIRQWDNKCTHSKS